MNKTELVAAVAQRADLSKKDAQAAVDAVLSTVTDTLKSGDTIALIGFGTFQVKERAAREGRNPSTGEAIKIPAAKIPSFKPGKALKDAM